MRVRIELGSYLLLSCSFVPQAARPPGSVASSNRLLAYRLPVGRRLLSRIGFVGILTEQGRRILLASVLQLVILARTTGSLPRRHLRHNSASYAGVGGAAAWVPRKGCAAVCAPRAGGGRLFSPGRCDGGAVRHCPISTQPPYVAARRRCSALLRYDVRPEATND